MTTAEARLEPDMGGHISCDVCSCAGSWLLRDSSKQLALCNKCAASVVFSNTETAASLLGHLPSREREAIVMRLWMSRQAS